MHDTSKSRRLKILYVSPDDLVAILDFRAVVEHAEYETFCPPLFEGLPDGYRVRGVQFMFDRDAFGVMIEHESFDEVPSGERIPEFADSFRLTRQAIKLPRQKPQESFEEHVNTGVFVPHMQVVDVQNGMDIYLSGVVIGAQVAAAERLCNAATSEAPATQPEQKKKSWEFLGPPL
jgi:hypothetical protein